MKNTNHDLSDNRHIRKKDRRAEKTAARLHEALAELVREKPFDDIAVKEILQRADVARSTFYMHFDGKDELLISGIENILQSADRSQPLCFSLPMFAHIEKHRGNQQSPRAPREMHERLERAITEMLESDHGVLLARWIALTFVLVLNWWTESDSPISAREVDALFRRLVGTGLNGMTRP